MLQSTVFIVNVCFLDIGIYCVNVILNVSSIYKIMMTFIMVPIKAEDDAISSINKFSYNVN